jgi:DNA invertase Pin-like site-specific DNA recombinase
MRSREQHTPMPGWHAGIGSETRTARTLGYVSAPAEGQVDCLPLADQAIAIERTCIELGLPLGQVMRDAEPGNGSGTRPALKYAFDQLLPGHAGALVVARLDCLAGSAAGVGAVVESLGQSGVRLVVSDLGLDTDSPAGRTAVRAIVAAGELENTKLAERTRRGLAAARRKGAVVGRPAVIDRPELSERIRTCRADGMTLQAIADRLNEDGVPTLRGGAEWRPSSVQAAAGYKRPPGRRNARRLGRGPAPSWISPESSAA